MKDVVLLGAGASADAEVPTTFQLTERILAELAEESRQALSLVCERLAEGPNGLDVERVFTAVELLAERERLEIGPFVDRWNSDALRWDRQFYAGLAKRMIEGMRDVIAATEKGVAYLNPLVRWAADSRQAMIVTLNYDRAIEVAGGWCCRRRNRPATAARLPWCLAYAESFEPKAPSCPHSPSSRHSWSGPTGWWSSATPSETSM